VPAAASTTSFSTNFSSRPALAPASASASATKAKYAGEQAITAVAASNCESGISTTAPRTLSFSRTSELNSPAMQSTPPPTSTATLGMIRPTSALGNAAWTSSREVAPKIEMTDPAPVNSAAAC